MSQGIEVNLSCGDTITVQTTPAIGAYRFCIHCDSRKRVTEIKEVHPRTTEGQCMTHGFNCTAPVTTNETPKLPLVKSVEIWNTHYRCIGDSWRATIIFADGTRKSTMEALTFAQVTYWVSCYQPKPEAIDPTTDQPERFSNE